MESFLEHLPNEMIQKIVILAAEDAKTMFICEQTCKVLHQVVQDDKTWEFLPGVSRWKRNGELLFNRYRACVHSALLSIRDEQKNRNDNILVSELGVQGWSSIVNTVVSRFVLVEGMNLQHESFRLRGDTLFVLAELVQANIIWFLDRALVSQVHSLTERFERNYPVVCPRDLHLSDGIAGDMTFKLFPFSEQLDTDEGMGVLSENTLLRDRIVRRLSRRAGIPKMEIDAYNAVWCVIVQFVYMLVRPACWELVDMKEGTDSTEKRMLHPGQTIRDISPISTRVMCDSCSDGVCFVHVLVPRQIEHAALSVVGNLRPNRVYGDEWLVPGVFGSEAERDEAVEREVVSAESMYECIDNSDAKVGWAFEVAAKKGELGAMDVDSWSLTSDSDSDNDGSDTCSSLEEDGESIMSEGDY